MTRRWISLLLVCLCLLLSGCAAEQETEGFETMIVPERYYGPVENGGHVETLTYDVEAYAVEAKEGLAPGSLFEEKKLYVYLPAGYDSAKQYDVLYLLHGSGETEDYWFYTPKTMSSYFRKERKIDSAQFTANYTINMLDQLVSRGECKEFIVVTPTFFSTLRSETEYGGSRDDTMFWLDSFERELRDDIIPLVETTYPTYAGGDTSQAGLQASREHRAIAGFSRGSRFTTRVAVPNMVDVFGWFGSFHGWETLTTDTLRSTLESNPDCPILYWYNGFGPKDDVTLTHAAQCQAVLEEMADVFQEGINFVTVEKPEAQHYYDTALMDLYNFTRVVFKTEEERIK